jgi:hypothetical protein
MSQVGCFDLSDHLKQLSDAGDPLAALVDTVEFEVLRAVLDIALDDSDGSNGGQPPDDPVAMFKALVDEFENQLQGSGYLSIRVSAPCQRNNNAQKQTIKQGKLAGEIGLEKPVQGGPARYRCVLDGEFFQGNN